MASTRIAVSALLRTFRTTAIPRILRTRAQTVQRKCYPQISLGIQRRWNSQQSGSSKAYEYQDIVDLIEKPSKERILIDAREPHELFQTGRIPGALNIPVSSQADAFFITDEEFEDRFGFERPGKDTEVVFYCKAGVRSQAAANLAKQGGWEKVAEYRGSWLDWEGQGGKVER